MKNSEGGKGVPESPGNSHTLCPTRKSRLLPFYFFKFKWIVSDTDILGHSFYRRRGKMFIL